MAEQMKYDNLEETKKFQSDKNCWYVALLWLPSVLFISTLLLIPKQEIPIVILILLGVLAAFFIWILFDTQYKIKSNYLYYKSGVFRGKIAVTSIRKIVRDDALLKMSIRKPALSNKGITVFYDQNDVYISPQNRIAFIAALCQLNPDIIVIGFDDLNPQ